MLDFNRTRVRSICRAGVLNSTMVLLLLGASRLCAQQSLASISAEVQRIFRQAKDAVVRVKAEDEHGTMCGTGFFLDSEGTILTTYAVGGESFDIVVEFGASRYLAHRLVSDPRSGVAILKVDAKTPWLPLGHSDELQVAAPVVVVGYPMDLPATPNFGMIGGFDQKYLNQYFSTSLIRANLSVQRGEVGAPLLNLKGEAVGILLFSIGDRTACYALPMKAVEKVRDDYVRFGAVRPGWIGVFTVNAEEAVHDSTAIIQGFAQGSPAEDSGLQPGDVLIRVGSTEIHSPPDVLSAAFFLRAQEDVPITVVRDGKEITVTVTATHHPGAPVQQTPLIAPGYPATDENSLRLRGYKSPE